MMRARHQQRLYSQRSYQKVQKLERLYYLSTCRNVQYVGKRTIRQQQNTSSSPAIVCYYSNTNRSSYKKHYNRQTRELYQPTPDTTMLLMNYTLIDILTGKGERSDIATEKPFSQGSTFFPLIPLVALGLEIFSEDPFFSFHRNISLGNE